MALWIFLISMLALLSYLADVGIEPFTVLNEPVPLLRASSISVALIVCCVFMLLRIARLARRGEKEQIKEKLDHLVGELHDIGEHAIKRESERLAKSWQSSQRKPSKSTETFSPEWDKDKEKESKS